MTPDEIIVESKRRQLFWKKVLENNRLKSAVRRAKNLLRGAKQYDRLAASVYLILDEVKDIGGKTEDLSHK